MLQLKSAAASGSSEDAGFIPASASKSDRAFGSSEDAGLKAASTN